MVRLILPSDIRFLPLVNAVTEEFARELHLDQEAVEAVALSVVEASTNAISHGNRYDAMKDVEICYGRSPDAMVVTVRDQGTGFDPASVPDPLAPENLLRESGRGIFICRSFMDEVGFEIEPGGGTTIRLVKRLNARGT
jgi:serine/threonine-protein kinase RsbW